MIAPAQLATGPGGRAGGISALTAGEALESLDTLRRLAEHLRPT